MPRNLKGAGKKMTNNHQATQHIFNDFHSDKRLLTALAPFLSVSIPYLNKAKPQYIMILSNEVCKKNVYKCQCVTFKNTETQACVLRFTFKYFHLQFLKKSLYNNYFLYENIVSAWEQN